MSTLNEQCKFLFSISHLSPEDTLILLLSIEQTRNINIENIKQFKNAINKIIKDTSVINIFNRIITNNSLLDNFNQIYWYEINENIIKQHYIMDIYNELCAISHHNRHDLIMTPYYIYYLIFKIFNIQKNDILFDPCMGLGQILNYSPSTKIIGVEIDEELYSIAYLHSLYCKKDSALYHSDFRNINLNYRPMYAIMNPPYTMGNKENSSEYEISFIKNLLDIMPKNSKVAVIVPQSTFNFVKPLKTKIRNSILLNNQLDGIISLNTYIYTNATISTCIAFFTTGKTNGNKHLTKFIDFKDDGCEENNRGHIPTDVTFEKINTICNMWNNEDSPSYNDLIHYHHVEPSHDWSLGYYISPITIPLANIFSETVKYYMIFYLSSLLNDHQYLFCQEHRFSKKRNIKTIKNQKWDNIELTEIFKIEGTKRSEMESTGYYPYVSSTAKNNGHYSYCDFYTDEGNCIAVESAINGFSTYQEYNFASKGHIELLIPKFKLSRCSALFIVAILNNLHTSKYNYGYKASKTRLRKESLLLPVDKNGAVDFDFMEEYIDRIWNSQKKIISERL